MSSQWQAPEQVGHHYLLDDEKSDVYSLGFVLYFLLTGDQQWPSDSSNSAAKWTHHGKVPEIPESIRKSKHPFDVAVGTAIANCLRQNPKDRPTASEVADFLHDALVNAGLKDAPLKIAEERDAEERVEERGQDDQADDDRANGDQQDEE